jgi:hypothetical protein
MVRARFSCAASCVDCSATVFPTARPSSALLDATCSTTTTTRRDTNSEPAARKL